MICQSHVPYFVLFGPLTAHFDFKCRFAIALWRGNSLTSLVKPCLCQHGTIPYHGKPIVSSDGEAHLERRRLKTRVRRRKQQGGSRSWSHYWSHFNKILRRTASRNVACFSTRRGRVPISLSSTKEALIKQFWMTLFCFVFVMSSLLRLSLTQLCVEDHNVRSRK